MKTTRSSKAKPAMIFIRRENQAFKVSIKKIEPYGVYISDAGNMKSLAGVSDNFKQPVFFVPWTSIEWFATEAD